MEIIQKSKMVEISKVDNWKDNPRAIHPKDLERLKHQIADLGIYKPLICEKAGDRYITIGGNMRLQAYKDLGHKAAWIVVIKAKNEAERVKISLSDNDRAGYYQEERLYNQIKNMDINLKDYKIETRIPKFDLTILMDKFTEQKLGEDDIPAFTRTMKIKIGDIYELGQHRLMCGDATEKSHFQALLHGARAQMIFTDPPYNVAYKGAFGKKRRAIANDDMDPAKFYSFMESSIRNMLTFSEGGIYICMGWSSIDVLKQAFEKTGGHVSNIIVWVKNNITIGRGDYQNKHELILYGWSDDLPNHYFIFSRDHANVWQPINEFKTRWDGKKTTIELPNHTIEIAGKAEGQILKGKEKQDIWLYNKPQKSADHPTMKPVALITEAITNSSRQGDAVLDCFNGSGSTMIACEKTERRFYGIELDPIYIETAIKRWQGFTGKTARKVK